MKVGLYFTYLQLILTIIFFPFFPIYRNFFIDHFSFYIFYFFRDPIRMVPTENVVVSPADGTITFVYWRKQCNPREIAKSKINFLKISIFLSIFNVHVNRIPISGTIKKIIYISGKFINANIK